MPSIATTLHKFPQLPHEVQAQVFSFANNTERASVASKPCKEAAESALTVWSADQLKALPEDSFVSRFARREVLEDTPEGQIELVKRTRKAAVEYLRENRGGLLPPDIQEMNLQLPNPRFAELSFTGLNAASDRIDRNRKDQILVEAFNRILLMHPGIAATLQLQPNETLHSLAELIRDWMRDPAHQALRNEVLVLPKGGLRGIPIEYLQFPNIRLDYLLILATRKQQLDVVDALLNDPREIGIFALTRSFINTLQPTFKPELTAAFVRSPREIGNGSLGMALAVAIRNDHRSLFELILNSQREIRDVDLGHALIEAIRLQKWDEATAILRSNRPFDIPATEWGTLFLFSVSNNQWELAQLLFENENPINPVNLGLAVNLAFQKGNYPFVQSILASNRPIHSHYLGKILTQILNCLDEKPEHEPILQSILGGEPPIDLDQALLAAYSVGKNRKYIRQILERNDPIDPYALGHLLSFAEDHSSLVAFILQTNRPIDPTVFGISICHALQKGNLRFARQLIRSGQEITATLWGLALFTAYKKGDSEIAREILKLPLTRSSKIACAALGALAGLLTIMKQS